MFTVNKATVNARDAPLPVIFKVWIVSELPVVCCIRNTNLLSVIAVGLLTIKLLPAAGVNTISLTALNLNCELSGDTNIAQVTFTVGLAVTVLAPSKIELGAAPDNCKVVLNVLAVTGNVPQLSISVSI